MNLDIMLFNLNDYGNARGNILSQPVPVFMVRGSIFLRTKYIVALCINSHVEIQVLHTVCTLVTDCSRYPKARSQTKIILVQ